MRSLESTILCLILLWPFFSCNDNNQQSTLTYLVAKDSFTEKITLEGTVEAVNSRTVVCPMIGNLTIKYLIEDGTLVKAGDTVCVLENKQLVDAYENAIKNLEQSKAEYNKIQADLALDMAMLEAQVKNNEAQTSITNLDSVQLKYSSPTQKRITELELQIAKIEKQKLDKKLIAVKKINQSEVRKAALRIKQNENNVKRNEDQLGELVLLAPIDGLAMRAISYFNDLKIKEGDNIYPMMPVVEIPDLTVMRVAFSATESQFKRLAIDQKVEYTFDAMPGNIGSGKITFMTSVGREISRNSKIKLFDFKASIDSCQTTPGAGLSANGQIIINEITDTITVPSVAVFEEDSMKVVYLQDGKHFTKQEVITAEGSQKVVIIAAGLNQGDVISLVKPKSSQVKEFNALDPNIKAKLSLLQSKIKQDTIINEPPIHATPAEIMNQPVKQIK